MKSKIMKNKLKVIIKKQHRNENKRIEVENIKIMEELSLKKFEEASEKVKEVTLDTNLVFSEHFSSKTGNKVYLKPENMQYTGAYKVRGAYYKISTLSDEERKKRVDYRIGWQSCARRCLCS